MAFRITFFGTKPYDIKSFNERNKDYGFDLKFFTGNLSKDNIILTKDADAVCIFVNDIADREIIKILAENGVKLLALRCAGYNNVDLKAAYDYGLPVVRVPAYSPYAVAEHTVALMLALNRRIPRATWRTRDGNFSLNGLLGFDMHNKTAGIIGTGKIAKILIQILRGFGMNVLAYDPYPDYNFARDYNVVYTSLDELYHSSDIISLHCPLTEETKYLINDYSISKMKDGVMIINTGRGQLIHTNALIDALKVKKVGWAGLDVYEEEADYFYEDRSESIIDDDVLARLLSFNNVIVTSHQAFFTQEALGNIADTTLQNIKVFIEKNKLVNEVKLPDEHK
ncbi:MAG: 2-hydroxyacid dehydrogenase [Bacteroidales bacterium]|nr:2-hydroxyacid dehydrogenase [Bacteroidales bacterium]